MIGMPVSSQSFLMVAKPPLAHVQGENLWERGRIGGHGSQGTTAHKYTPQDHHLTQPGFDWQLGYDPAQGSQFVVLVQAFHVLQQHFCLDDSVQWRRLDGLAEEVSDGTQPQQFDAEGKLVQGRPEHLRSHVLLQFFKSCFGAQVEADAGTYTTRSTLPLLHVGLRGPDGGIAGHVVV